MRSLLCSVILSALLAKVDAAIGPTAELVISNDNIAPDGYPRDASLINDVFPGPLITGNKGDSFSLNVINELSDPNMDLVTSIHWHGLFQTNTNYADGGAFVNQCPIAPSKNFIYEFSGGDQTGTYWYHSHYQAQYCDGVRGAFVIYDPDDPQANLYDIDNEKTIITLADWYHTVSPVVAQELVPEFGTTLINGMGRSSSGPSVDLAVVNVLKGQRYRLRVVSISCDPNYTFSIDNHRFTIIEVDGVNHQPLVVDSLQIFAGQRYSLVLTADQEIDNYWIRALPNIEGHNNFANFSNLAILRYVGAFPQNPSVDPTKPITYVLPLIETNLHPLDSIPVPGKPFPGGADKNIKLAVRLSSDFTRFLVNNVSFEGPDVPVLLQILNGANATELMPAGSIYPLDANQSVEISIPGGALGGPHPIHLHGHNFHVVRSAGSSTYNYNNPVIRDVANMGSLTTDNLTIRFMTDNPGPWFIHCHIDWHLEKGFAVVMAEEVPQVPSHVFPPPDWFDLCPAYDAFINPSDRSAHSAHPAPAPAHGHA